MTERPPRCDGLRAILWNGVRDVEHTPSLVGGRTLDCPVTQGQLASICEPTATPVAVSATTTITFRVKDADALVDDVVGGASVTDLLTFESGRPIAMTVSDSVTWAELVLEPVSAPEPPAAAR